MVIRFNEIIQNCSWLNAFEQMESITIILPEDCLSPGFMAITGQFILIEEFNEKEISFFPEQPCHIKQILTGIITYQKKSFFITPLAGHIAVQPPSAIRFCPVMYRAASERRKATGPLISSGVPILFIGTLFS